MKLKKLLFLLAIVAAPFYSQAQDIELGIKLGANLAKMNGDTWEDGYKAGFLGGLFGGISGERFGVRLEGLFSQTTYTSSGQTFYDAYKGLYNQSKDSLKKGAFRVNYLNIPVLLKVKLVSGLSVLVGPQFSGIVSIQDRDDLLKDAKGLFKGGDVSGVVGLEFNFSSIHVGARYILGFSDLQANKAAIADTWQQRTIQLHIGYSFL